MNGRRTVAYYPQADGRRPRDRGSWLLLLPVLILGTLPSFAEAAGRAPCPVCPPPPPPCYPSTPNCPRRSDILLVGGHGWSSLPVAISDGNGSWNIPNSYVGAFGSWAATPGAMKVSGDFNG